MAECADGIAISDPKGKITDCNAALARLVGRNRENLVGELISSIVNFENVDDGNMSMSGGHKVAETMSGPAPDTVANGDQPKTATIINKSGAQLHLPVAHVPIESDGRFSGFLLTIVYVLQANPVQQAQTDFVSTVSHELRTPLTSIKGFADTILRAGDRLDVSQQRRYVGIIKDQADRLTRLVEDLLAVSRLESKRLQFTIRAIDLEDAIERVVMHLTEKASDHRIRVDIHPGLLPVLADADRLEQILTNLIDNAIKYSPAKTTVTVVARMVQRENKDAEWVEFAVTDEGAGIPEEHLPKIFAKFGRLDNPLVRQTEGTGLGLYITRSLVIALGGEIEVTSKPGRTTFTVRLPSGGYEQQVARGRDF